MSFEITESFVQEYGGAVEHLAQQEGTVLSGTVTTVSGIVGKRKFVDQIGATTGQKRTTRHSDSPLISTPHARRALDLADYEIGDLVDDLDKVKTLNDPSNDYTMAFGFWLGRQKDQVIIDQGLGTALTGETGGTSVTLPTASKVAVDFGGASIGLTVAKLRQARHLLRKNEAIRNGELITVACTSKQIDDLLSTTDVTSADFNVIKTLVNGEVDTFMGFRFVQTELLPLAVSTDVRRIMVYPKSAIKLGIGADVRHRIEERADKSFAMYPYSSMSIGAVRMEEKKVVEISCDESP